MGDLNDCFDWGQHFMMHRRIQRLQKSILILFLLELYVGCEVSDADDFALLVLESVVHSLDNHCFVGHLVVSIQALVNHLVDLYLLVAVEFQCVLP